MNFNAADSFLQPPRRFAGDKFMQPIGCQKRKVHAIVSLLYNDLNSETERQTTVKKILLVLAVAALYALHQDIWNWRNASPVFGILPIGMFYHACYSVAAAGLMFLLVKFAWPGHLEEEIEGERKGDAQ